MNPLLCNHYLPIRLSKSIHLHYNLYHYGMLKVEMLSKLISSSHLHLDDVCRLHQFPHYLRDPIPYNMEQTRIHLPDLLLIVIAQNLI